MNGRPFVPIKSEYLFHLKKRAYLCPSQRPLQIKKLLDDANPTVDLGMSMTVEDVFVDTGKASADGHDQRAIVRVVQKPAAYAPQRFASVDQDWDSAVGRRSNNQLANTERFDTIEEEETPSNSARESPTGHRQHDAPLPSVEAQPKYYRNGTSPGSPDASSGSEELGDSPSPRKTRRSRKRKQSLGEDGPVKQRRVEETQSQANDLVSPHRKRATVPTFASPRRRPNLSERRDVNNNIGLGVTRSPLFNTPVDSDASSRQKTRLTAANALAQSKNQPPHSAMRKSPTSSHSEKRTSVSFNESVVVDSEARPTPKTSSSKAKKTQHVDRKKAMQGTPTSKGSPTVLPNSNTKSTPKEELLDAQFARIQARIAQKKAMAEKEKQQEKGGQGKENERNGKEREHQDKERERQEKERERQEKEKEERERQEKSERREKEKARREEEEKEEEEKERANIEAKLADSSTDTTIKSIAEKILQKWRRVDETREKKDSLGDVKFRNAIRNIKRQLNPLRKRLEDLEATKATEQPEIREASPPMPDARITRSLRSPGAVASSTTEAPTWSFGNVTQASPDRRGSRNSANGLHESPRRPQSSHLSPDIQQMRSPSVVIHNSPRRGGSFTKPPTETPNPTETDVEMKDVDEEATHTVADEPTEQPINEEPEKETEEATEEGSDDSSSESSEERSRESSKALGEEPKPPSISNTNEAEEHDGDDSDEVAESELNDGDSATNQYQDASTAPSGLIDDAAEDDDEEEDEEEEDSEMDDFIDDGEEESEEEEEEEDDEEDDEGEEYEDAKDHEEPSGQDTVNGVVDTQVEETQEDKTEPPAVNNNEDERDESGNEWAEVSEGDQPDEPQPQVKPQVSLNNEDGSDASSEESDESESDFE